MSTVEYLGTPCRVFAFMSGEHIPVDPWDGREKYVMGTNSASTAKGCVVFFDPDTLTAESIEVPDDTGLWALLYLPEYERLLTGTNAYDGWLHALDLKTRTWMEPLRIEGEEYLWNLARGGDGKIYGGSFPGCILSCYDPVAHTMVSEGRVSSNPDNLYSRMVHSLPDGNLLIYVGEQEYETHLFDVKTRQFRQVFGTGEHVKEVRDGVIMTGKSDGLYFYDAETFEPLDGPIPYTNAAFAKHPKVEQFLRTRLNDMYLHLLPYRQDFHMKRLNDGRAIGVLKHRVFIVKDGEITYHDVNCEPPAMNIHSMAVAPDGVVWFGSGYDNTAGYYDPKTGKHWNSPAVTQCGGEIYGVVPHNGKLYFSAYAGGDHILYDPNQPWDQFHNVNPKTLQSVAPQKMGRPTAGSLMGPDGNIWTGWCGNYGIYGGGISRWNVQTNEITGWFGVVPEQSIRYMAAGKKCLFATSHWMNSGLPYRFDDEFSLIRLDTECNVNWSEKFQLGQFPECLAVVNGRVYMSMRDRLDGMAKILVYDEETMEKIAEKSMNPLGGPGKYECEKKCIRALLSYGEDKLVAFIDDEAHLLDGETLEILQTAKLPDTPDAFTIGEDRTIYFAIDEKLYRILF